MICSVKLTTVLNRVHRIWIFPHFVRRYCDVGETLDPSNKFETKTNLSKVEISGLAKALGKFRDLDLARKKDEVIHEKPKESFLTLLRNSSFVQLGDPKNKIVVGKIFQVVNQDLYIDFGGKFYCVCRQPSRNSEMYMRGAKVKVKILELELCSRFLGAVEDLTLLEADANIQGLIWSPFGTEADKKKPLT